MGVEWFCVIHAHVRVYDYVCVCLFVYLCMYVSPFDFSLFFSLFCKNNLTDKCGKWSLLNQCEVPMALYLVGLKITSYVAKAKYLL